MASPAKRSKCRYDFVAFTWRNVILSTELKLSHAQEDYTSVHNNNLHITPALSAFSQVYTNTRLTEATSTS